MMSDKEALQILWNKDYDRLLQGINATSAHIIQNKIQEIPSYFYEPTIAMDETGKNRISIIQFSTEIANMNNERKKGLMSRYQIRVDDMQKLQGIVDSIKVATEYGHSTPVEEKQEKEEVASYGFSLSSHAQIDRAYPLWVAYLCADALSPLHAVKEKLREDGTEGQYNPEMIVGLIEHTNALMNGKSEEEKKNFFIQSISGILGDFQEVKPEKDTVEIME